MRADTALKIFRPFKIDGLKRMGSVFDGGYIIHYPSLKDADYLLNYGVGYNVTFEQEFFKATGVPTLAFDPTLSHASAVFADLKKGGIIPFLRHIKKIIFWAFTKRTLKDSKIELIKEGIADTNTKDFKTLAYHFEKYGLANKKIILKMDVEGWEYPIFNSPATYPVLGNTIQVILEFHNVNRHIGNIEEILGKLSATHSLIHIHANNHAGTFDYAGKTVPNTLEMTFLLNSYFSRKEYVSHPYPVEGLDQPCDRLKQDIVIDFFM